MTLEERQRWLAEEKRKEKNARTRSWEIENRVERNKAVALRRAKNPEKRRLSSRKHWYRKNFGMTLEKVDTLFISQNKRCLICSSTEAPRGRWHLDHCHKTGKVRGILCGNCNLMLGNAKDKIHVLQAAIKYLEVYNGRERRTSGPFVSSHEDSNAPDGSWPKFNARSHREAFC